MGGYEPARGLDVAAAGLRALADELDAGDGPRRGQGVRRVAGVTVVPLVVHDALCGWRVATPQDSEPPVMGCAGCGLGYLVEDALSTPGARPGSPGFAIVNDTTDCQPERATVPAPVDRADTARTGPTIARRD